MSIVDLHKDDLNELLRVIRSLHSSQCGSITQYKVETMAALDGAKMFRIEVSGYYRNVD